MAFEGPVFAWFILALFPIALPVLLALILSRVLHIEAGCLPLLILIAVGIMSAFGIAAFLDSSGDKVTGEILGKKDFIVYHLDGSWNRKMVAEIGYRSSDTALPATASLQLPPARFDEIHQGDFVELRCSDPKSFFRITRLADQGTMSQVWYLATDQPFLSLFVLGLLLVMCARFRWNWSLPMLFFLTGFVTIGAWWMSGVAIPLWEQSSTVIGSLNNVSARVREIHPPYLGSGLQGWISNNLYSTDDLILLNLIPLGQSQQVLSVDAVDQGSANLRPGQSLNVRYSAADPRYALVPDATRRFLWKNGMINTFLAGLALFGVIRVAFLLQKRTDPKEAMAGRR